MTTTQEQLKRWYEYKEYGVLLHKRNGNGCKIGSVEGSLHKDGYMVLKVGQTPQLLHRMIFLYHHGYLPRYIDHINTNKADNRIENLRETTHSPNCANISKTRRNISGLKGVFYSPAYKGWVGCVIVQGKSYTKYKKAPETCTATKDFVHAWVVSKRAELCGEFTNHG